MQLDLSHDAQGNLIARQRGGSILRLVIGLPLLLWGLVMLYGVVSSFVITVSEQGAAGLPQALIGSLVMALFTALVLPLGWWLVLSRHWVMMDGGSRDIVEVSDWRLGKKQKRTPASALRAVRLAVEPLNSSPSGSKSTKPVHVQQIRLLAREPNNQASIEIGWLEEKERELAITLAQQVAAALNLPLEVAPADAILYSPAREAAECG